MPTSYGPEGLWPFDNRFGPQSGLPTGVEGVGVAFDLGVADNWGIAGFHQRYQPTVFIFSAKSPIPVTNGHEVLLLDPFCSLAGMARDIELLGRLLHGWIQRNLMTNTFSTSLEP